MVTEATDIEPELRKKWGEAVKLARTEQGLSQAALAVAVGTTQQNISAIENGDHAGSTATQLRIAKVLGRKHSDLFYDPRLAEEPAS